MAGNALCPNWACDLTLPAGLLQILGVSHEIAGTLGGTRSSRILGSHGRIATL